MKTMILILLISILSATAYAQRLVEPVRVNVVEVEGASDTDKEFSRALRAELNKSKVVAFSSQSDFDIAVACAEISERGRHLGFATAVLIASPVGSRRRRFELSVHVGGSLQELAAELAARLDKDFKSERK